MKAFGILMSLLVSALVVYLTLQSYRQSNSGADSGLSGLTRPLEKARSVQSVVDLSAAQMAVQTYQIQQGAFPPSLKDLVSAGFVNESQIKNLEYDPATGKVAPHPE
jgi:competence protein ComGC